MRIIYFILLYILFLSSCGLPLQIKESYNSVLVNTTSYKIPNCKITKILTNANTEVSVTSNYLAKVIDITFSPDTVPTASPQIITKKNIRYANYKVLDSEKNIVACGNTGANGSFTVLLQDNTAYELIIYSSSVQFSAANAAVMQSPLGNKLYFIKKSFTTSQNLSLDLIANNKKTSSLSTHNSSLNTNNAGAFNILDQIIESNIFLKTNTEGCTLCHSPFDNTAFLEIYWKSGLNPNSYVEEGGLPISFFINFTKENRRYYRIFILGGLNGINDENVDSDEFDNSVIIHEYAHFISTVFSKDSSPGGAHYGITSIDPRLAWSEGFANFFQAAVLNKNFYLDSGPKNIIVSLEDQTSVFAQDKPAITGEGNYREFSIARFLWDIIDSDSNNQGSDDDNYQGSPADFKLIWSLITSPEFKSSNFISLGALNEIQNFKLNNNLVPWSSLRDLHKQNNPNHLFFRSLYSLQLGESCQSTNAIDRPLLQFNTPQNTPQNTSMLNYMVNKKRVLEYNHKKSGTVVFGLKNLGPSNLENPIIPKHPLKFYIQDFSVPMENTAKSNFKKTHESKACTKQNYHNCLEANLEKGQYLIEVVLGSDITENLNFQFFANSKELCGKHKNFLVSEAGLKQQSQFSLKQQSNQQQSSQQQSSNQQQSNQQQSSENLTIFHKLSSPYRLSIKLINYNKKDLSYQVEASFINKDLNLKNLNLQWRHSKTIKIIKGQLTKTFKSVKAKEKITMQLLIKAKEPLEKANIYFISSATYEGQTLPMAIAFNLKQLIKKSKQITLR